MCGINGFTFHNPELVRQMNAVTAHRGRDQTAVFEGEGISLGFNRLSIIDLSERGSQPMRDEHSELVIVFNGEIYNFKELRAELEKKYSFRSASDTEVVLYAYREWGSECVKKFNGMFAFAIWDQRTQELFIARDHIGIKPLYYFFDGKRLIFSSEIKAILEHDIPHAVDRDAFHLFFSVLYVPEPYTMFAGIKKLPAASFLRYKNGQLRIEKYWGVSNFSDLHSQPEAQSEIRRLFDDSVRGQLVSDRPVGVYLSGGLDSTAVLGSVRHATSERTKTFSVGFDIADNDKFNADFLLARQTAQLYDTDHHELTVSAADVQDNLEKIVWHLDEPNFNPTAAAQYLLSREAKKTVTVVLGGDGGDELFGGYPRYYYSRLLSILHAVPYASSGIAHLLRFLGQGVRAKQIALQPDVSRVLAFLAQKDDLLAEVIRPAFLKRQTSHAYIADRFFRQIPTGDFEKFFMDIDRQGWLVDESLFRTDRMTMAWGIEQRVPILDYRLVELANRIPTAWKFSVWNQRSSSFQGKRIWREAIADYLPSHVLNQQKRGWFTPMAKWLRGELREYVSDILHHANPEYFDARGIERIWQDHLSGKRYNLNMIWAIVMWQLWYDSFINTKKHL